MNLWVIFVTGLTVGGLTCLAVQGGLLASVIAAREEEDPKNAKSHALYATVVFLFAKFISYAILGFVLGTFGGALTINNTIQTLIQMAAGIYMLLVALNLLEVHPIFRYAIIQPPRFLTKLVRNQSKSKDIFAPALLGAMTIFIPCGTTLTMEALAISSGNAIVGSSIMVAFILGTIPLFFGVGFVTSILGETFKIKFLKVAAFGILYLGLTSINGSLVALGSPLSIQSVSSGIMSTISFSSDDNTKKDVSTNQNPEILITSRGYTPDLIRVQKGVPVNLKLTSKDAFSCASAFRIPAFKVSRNLRPNETQTITFTPQQSGQFVFSCSMGMYRGVIEVI